VTFCLLVQHVDTGEILMQGYADRAAIAETLQTGYNPHILNHSTKKPRACLKVRHD
jgi:phosphoribosyl-AMP cyclohydrolase